MKNVEISGEEIDASSDEGMEEARKMGVMSTPTVIFFDENGKKVDDAHSVDEVKEKLS